MTKVKNTARRIEVERIKLVTGIELPIEGVFFDTGKTIELEHTQAVKLCKTIGGIEMVVRPPSTPKRPAKRGRPRKKNDSS